MKRALPGLMLLVVLAMPVASEALPPQITPPQPRIGVSSSEYKFSLAGVTPDRRVGFFTEKEGGEFSYWCGDCSFSVSEFGIAGETDTIDLGSRIVFKLSQDGTLLTTTCKASACIIVISEETKSGRGPFSTSLRSLKNSETIEISTRARVVFTV